MGQPIDITRADLTASEASRPRCQDRGRHRGTPPSGDRPSAGKDTLARLRLPSTG